MQGWAGGEVDAGSVPRVSEKKKLLTLQHVKAEGEGRRDVKGGEEIWEGD